MMENLVKIFPIGDSETLVYESKKPKSQDVQSK